jgi:hypothetical protein
VQRKRIVFINYRVIKGGLPEANRQSERLNLDQNRQLNLNQFQAMIMIKSKSKSRAISRAACAKPPAP